MIGAKAVGEPSDEEFEQPQVEGGNSAARPIANIIGN